MQGYILHMNRARDEDLVVSILTKQHLETLYRFYGARHGTINLGFKVDFESEMSLKSSIGRLRDVIHLGFPWITDYERLRLWQQFIALFYPHLSQSEETGSFYFELIDHAAHQWQRQNPKRIALEAYARLLSYEGRLHDEARCFFCDQPIGDDVSMIRALIPAHPGCSHRLSVNKKGMDELYSELSTLFLDDLEIDRLWNVLLEGL